MTGESATRTERSFEIVARRIEKQIRDENLVAGDPLPAETALAATLGVHRSTLREAIRLLENDGLVTREAGRRKLRVCAPGPGHLSGRVASVMFAQQVTFRELYEAMRAVEPACARAAAERASAQDIDRLADNLERTRQAIADGTSLVALDIEFHQTVANAGQSRALEMMREPLGRLFFPAFEEIMSRLNVSDRLLTAHENIVALVKAHDIQGAGLWMQRHIDDFRRGYELAQIDMNRPIPRGAN